LYTLANFNHCLLHAPALHEMPTEERYALLLDRAGRLMRGDARDALAGVNAAVAGAPDLAQPMAQYWHWWQPWAARLFSTGMDAREADKAAGGNHRIDGYDATDERCNELFEGWHALVTTAPTSWPVDLWQAVLDYADQVLACAGLLATLTRADQGPGDVAYDKDTPANVRAIQRRYLALREEVVAGHGPTMRVLAGAVTTAAEYNLEVEQAALGWVEVPRVDVTAQRFHAMRDVGCVASVYYERWPNGWHGDDRYTKPRTPTGHTTRHSLDGVKQPGSLPPLANLVDPASTSVYEQNAQCAGWCPASVIDAQGAADRGLVQGVAWRGHFNPSGRDVRGPTALDTGGKPCITPHHNVCKAVGPHVLLGMYPTDLAMPELQKKLWAMCRANVFAMTPDQLDTLRTTYLPSLSTTDKKAASKAVCTMALRLEEPGPGGASPGAGVGVVPVYLHQSDMGRACRAWHTDPANTERGDWDERLKDLCKAHPNAAYCQCVARADSNSLMWPIYQHYTEGGFSHGSAQCWFAPCADPADKLVPTGLQGGPCQAPTCANVLNIHDTDYITTDVVNMITDCQAAAGGGGGGGAAGGTAALMVLATAATCLFILSRGA
jgi:hypothetical protein